MDGDGVRVWEERAWAGAAHLVVLKGPYLDAALAGTKRVESRLSRTRCAPFGQVAPGDVLLLKESCGPLRACARAGRVLTYANLAPADVEELRRRHNHLIAGPAAYWRDKRRARFATLVWLEEVEPVPLGLFDVPKLHGAGWRRLGAKEAARLLGKTLAV